MAAILKVAALRKWTCLVFFCFLIVFYLRQKLEQFWEQCKEEDEGKGTELTSALISMWNWIVSSLWPGSQNRESKGRHTQGEGQLMPPCQAPATDILSHIVLISAVTDICHFGAAVSNTANTVFVSTCDVMKTMVSEGKVLIANVFDVSSSLVWKIAANLQAGLGDVWTCVSVAFRDAVKFLPDDFRTVSTIICLLCLLIIVFVCWRRHQLQVRNKRCYSPDYISNKNSSITPVSRRRVQNFSREIIPRFEADTVPGQRAPSESLCAEQETHGGVRGERTVAGTLLWWMACTVVPLLCLSLPWEFCRLYQTAVANKAAVASAGLPLECSTEPQSLLQTLTLWLSRQLAWSHGDPCDRYYQAMFVDPIWEITPIMVLTSVVTRAIVQPVEVAGSGLGRALRHFFREIPLHWQPACMLLMGLLLFLLLLLSCSYRLSVPLLFRMEPRTPVLSCGQAADAGQERSGQRRVKSRDHATTLSRRGVLAPSPDGAAEASHASYDGDLGGHDPQSVTRLSAYPAGYKREKNSSDDSHRDPEIVEKGGWNTRLDTDKISEFGRAGTKGFVSDVNPNRRDVRKKNLEPRNKNGGKRKFQKEAA